MSFLYRSNAVLRSAAVRPSPRLFSTAVVYQKSATETVKDGLKAVDRTVSDAAVKGIDVGVAAKDKATEFVGVDTSKAKAAAEETAGKAKGKAAEVKREAIGKKEETKGKASS